MDQLAKLSEEFTAHQLTASSYRAQLIAAITALDTSDLVLLAILLVQGAHTKNG